jgi:hypothetical protein
VRSRLPYSGADRPGSSGFPLFAYLFLATASDGVLDAMTNDGLGVAYFSPFDNRRYFLPWPPILAGRANHTWRYRMSKQIAEKSCAQWHAGSGISMCLNSQASLSLVMIASLRDISIPSGVKSNFAQNKKFKNAALRFADTSQAKSMRL